MIFEQLAPETKRILCPEKNGAAHDLVMTPPSLAREVVNYFKPSGVVLDPARGQGAFFDALAEIPSIKELRWCEITQGRDFFAETRPCDWIITNPPWSKMRRFLLHSMRLADNVVFLATLTHFVTSARLREIEQAGFSPVEALLFPHPPPPWPASGFQLAAVHIKRGYAGGVRLSRPTNGRQQAVLFPQTRSQIVMTDNSVLASFQEAEAKLQAELEALPLYQTLKTTRLLIEQYKALTGVTYAAAPTLAAIDAPAPSPKATNGHAEEEKSARKTTRSVRPSPVRDAAIEVLRSAGSEGLKPKEVAERVSEKGIEVNAEALRVFLWNGAKSGKFVQSDGKYALPSDDLLVAH